MTTYASNKDGNSIIVDAQEWEELQALVKRQRVIIEMYNEAVGECIRRLNFLKYDNPQLAIGYLLYLESAYAAAQDTTSMTGASEK